MKKVSIFEPYRKEIETLLDSGYSVIQTYRILEYKYLLYSSYHNLYWYIKRCGLKDKIRKYTSMVCSECSSCIIFEDTRTRTLYRGCVISKLIIPKNCKYSPMWCPKRMPLNDNQSSKLT